MDCRRVVMVALAVVLSVGACGGEAELSSEAPDTEVHASDSAIDAFWKECPEQASGAVFGQLGSEVAPFDTPEGAVIQAMGSDSVPPALATAVESALADDPFDAARTLTGQPVEVILPDGAGFALVMTRGRVAAQISVVEVPGGYYYDGLEYCTLDFEEGI
jgi:hypothetical protein